MSQSKKTSKRQSKKVVEEPVVVEPVVVDTPVVVSADVDTDVSTDVEQVSEKPSLVSVFTERLSFLQEQSSSVTACVKELNKVLKQLNSMYPKLQKEIEKDIKLKNKKKRNNKTNSKHTFNIPTRVDAELASFMGISKNDTVLRPDVTKAVSAYVAKNNLKIPKSDGRFNVDDTLSRLLGPMRFPILKKKPELGIGYTFKNLQTYLAPRYIKN